MDNQSKARRASFALSMVVLAIGVAACGPAAQPGAPQASPVGTQEKPLYGGTMFYAGLSGPSNLDVLSKTATGDNRNSGGVYDRLVDYDYADPDYKVDYKMVPGLAERWTISPDGKTYTFFLHKGVKWHDGEDFTAADVVYTFNRIVEIKPSAYGYLVDMQKIEAVDPYTVKLTLKAPDVTFLIGLGASNMGMQPKHLSDQGADLKKVAVGTGPFKIESFDSKSRTVWVKNENYWQQGLPYIDKVNIIWGLDKPSMLAAFTVGKVDNTWMISKIDRDTVGKSNPDFKANEFEYAGPPIYMNTSKPPFNDLRVRQAINLAVDRQEFIKVNGYGSGSLSCFLPGAKTGWCLPGWDQLPGMRQPKDQDIAEARRLLAEAGYANGFDFKVLYSTAYTQAPPLVELFAGEMKKIGLNAVLDPRDTPTYNDLLQVKKEYETASAQGAAWSDTTTKSNVYNWFHTKGAFTIDGVGNAELDKLIIQQAVTTNLGERKKMWQQMEKIVLDNVWAIPFTDNKQFSLVQPWLKGPMVLNGDSWQGMTVPRMATSWLDQEMLPQR